MDPTETLAELRDAARIIINEFAAGHDTVPPVAVKLAGRFLELDEWLRNGGFRPASWQS
jgi:hypothetical protein